MKMKMELLFREQDVVFAAAPHLGLFTVTWKVMSGTTHVISGDGQRSVTALQALAKGCWILPLKWVRSACCLTLPVIASPRGSTVDPWCVDPLWILVHGLAITGRVS